MDRFLVLLGIGLVLCGLAICGDEELIPQKKLEIDNVEPDWNDVNIKYWLDEADTETISHKPCSYNKLNKAYKACAEKIRPGLTDYVHHHHYLSGKNVSNTLNQFCGMRGRIHACLRDYVRTESCNHTVNFNVKAAYEKSEYFCEGDHVRPVISKVYKGISEVGTRRNEDPCVKMASESYNKCLSYIMLEVALEGIHDEKKKKERKIGNWNCVLKDFGSKVCPVEEGILIVTLINSRMFAPPDLGINVTRAIYKMDNYMQQYNEDHKNEEENNLNPV